MLGKLFIPSFIIASLLLTIGALADEGTQIWVNSDFTDSEIRNSTDGLISLPTAWGYNEEDNAFGDPPPPDNILWNTTNTVYDGTSIKHILRTGEATARNPYLESEFFTSFDETMGYHFVIEYKPEGDLTSYDSLNEGFFGCFIPQNATSSDFFCWNVNSSGMTGLADVTYENETFETVDNGFLRVEADIDFSSTTDGLTTMYMNLASNIIPQTSGDMNFTVRLIELYECGSPPCTIPPPPSAPSPQPSVTGTPAIIVQIIAVVVALGGIIGGGLFIQQSGRVDGTIIITGFVISLISIIFAVVIVGLV